MPTPVIELKRLVGAQGLALKLETRSQNGTWYDRLVPRLLALAPEGPLYEAGDGPLAISIAAHHQSASPSLEVWLPEDVPVDVVQALRGLHAKVTLTPFAEGPAGARQRARLVGPLLSDSGSMLALRVHVRREIIEELMQQAAPEVLVLGFDTGASAMAAIDLGVKQVVLVQPAAAQVLSGGAWKPHRLFGLASGSPVKIDVRKYEVETVSDEEAFATRQQVGAKEGLLLSHANAACVTAAMRVIARKPGAKVAVIADESGERYFPIDARFEAKP
ncbi:MAG: pyridoxal-phosphate dependent enzyme [Myxococcaceae bacterium]